MVKKTNSPARSPGGVVKDVRVKAKMLPSPVVVEKEKPVRISKLNPKGMRSIFGDKADAIQQLLEANETDSAVSLIYKKSLQTLIDMIPYAEHAIRKSKGARGVYQINSLISSMRELMTDIQSSQDRGKMGQAIVENIIRPAFADMGNDIVQEYSIILADAKIAMDPKEFTRFSAAVKESRARLADRITKQYRTIREDTVDYLQR